jgi:hypothetical protein
MELKDLAREIHENAMQPEAWNSKKWMKRDKKGGKR